MAQLKYRLVEEGAAEGRVPLNLAFVDKRDVVAAGLTYREACRAVIQDNADTALTVNILDVDAVTVTSDGIMADGAVVACACGDHGRMNEKIGFLAASEIPYTEEIIATEPHMKQWNSPFYAGRRLHRGPSAEDRKNLEGHNENMCITGRMCNNNTGSEMMNTIDMTEILALILGQIQIMHDGQVLIGVAGPEVSVGIGMVVREVRGRIFGWNYGAGKTAHSSGEYAKTVKSDYPVIAATKAQHAEYVLRALDLGLVPGRDLGSSPVNLAIAHDYGVAIPVEEITPMAWVELESVGMSKEKLAQPVAQPLTRQQIIDQADDILPGIPDGKVFQVKDICTYKTIEL